MEKCNKVSWKKYDGSPVIGDKNTGTCFDAYIMQDGGRYKMYFSWRPKASIALSLSDDGINWSEPQAVLGPNPGTGYEDDVNRNCVVKKDGRYLMWYTGQADGKSYIFYAVSDDGINWTKHSSEPIMKPEYDWEYLSVMNPCVLWDEDESIFKMWYAAGETYEPNVLGYATSTDGINWSKRAEPVFTADRSNFYEQDRVGGCQIIKLDGYYTMFYIGYEDIDTARICVARSKDGITDWARFPGNPIVSPDVNAWDKYAVYKPTVMYMEECDKWYLYYNGRNDDYELIGLAVHDGYDLWN